MSLCTVIFKSVSWRYSCRMIELFKFPSLSLLWKVQRQMYLLPSKTKTLLSFLGSALTMSFTFCILILWHLVPCWLCGTALFRASQFLGKINNSPMRMPFKCKPTNTGPISPITYFISFSQTGLSSISSNHPWARYQTSRYSSYALETIEIIQPIQL